MPYHRIGITGRMKTMWKVIVAIPFLLLLLIVLPLPAAKKSGQTGFTYSILAEAYLELPEDNALAQALQDFKPDLVRIPVYWPAVEPQDGLFDWRIYDRQLQLIEEHGAKAMLAIGHKLPRWPECHIPDWLDEQPEPVVKERLLQYMQAVVERYQASDVVESWQVENEALFAFGDCPAWSANQDRLKEEILAVRSVDSTRPIFTTDSGELSLWWRSAMLPVDGLGISVYRAVYSAGRIVHWPVNPYYYRIRAALVRPFVSRLIVSELQMEPWGARPVLELSPSEIEASFPPEELAQRLDFAQRLGADTVLAWGVEWWYYMKVQGNVEYWDAAQSAFNR